MKLSEFALSERLSGMYWVRRRTGDSLSWTVAAYAHGREPTAWQVVGVVGWRTAAELGIEEVHSYLGTAPPEAKIAGIMHKPPVVPAAPSPSPAPLQPFTDALIKTPAAAAGAALRNGFQELPRQNPLLEADGSGLSPLGKHLYPKLARPERPVIGSNAEPPRHSHQMPLPPDVNSP